MSFSNLRFQRYKFLWTGIRQVPGRNSAFGGSRNGFLLPLIAAISAGYTVRTHTKSSQTSIYTTDVSFLGRGASSNLVSESTAPRVS